MRLENGLKRSSFRSRISRSKGKFHLLYRTSELSGCSKVMAKALVVFRELNEVCSKTGNQLKLVRPFHRCWVMSCVQG